MRVSAEGATVALQDISIPVDFTPVAGTPFTIAFITLGQYKEARINGKRVASRWVHTSWVGSEGKVRIATAGGAAVSLSGFVVSDADWARKRVSVSRGELLYADDFGKGVEDRWVYEHKKEAGFHTPEVKDGWLHVARLSAAWCRFRSEGPVIYSFESRGVPASAEKPMSVTDACYFANTQWFNGPRDFFNEPHYDPGINVYTDLQGYWIDFGGNGNTTTRLRRLPYRQLLRQSIKREDMLKPQFTHRIEIVCAGEIIQFRVDGRTVLDCVDRNAYTSGHFGVLGFVRPVEIRKLRIYRARMAGVRTGENDPPKPHKAHLHGTPSR